MPKVIRPTYSVRPCRGLEELTACLHLQQRIWGYADSEIYPLRLFVNLTHIGGHVLGAFRQRKLVGFVAGMPAWRDGKRYLHSLSLGVERGHENQGLGRRLKLAQRRMGLEAGVRWIEWTFDPMRAKNAFFNLVRLGALTRRYVPDYYGHVESLLQQGLPSDRLVCEWRLNSARVRAAAANHPWRPRTTKPEAEVAIPADFAALAERDPRAAERLQSSVRRKLLSCFRRGLVVTGFNRDRDVGRYRLESLHENKSY